MAQERCRSVVEFSEAHLILRFGIIDSDFLKLTRECRPVSTLHSDICTIIGMN